MPDVVDSLKQKSQDKPTGSNKCQKHNIYFSQRGFTDESYCHLCEIEEKSTQKAKLLFKSNTPAIFQNASFASYKPINKVARKNLDKCLVFAREFEGNLIMIGGVGTGKTHLAYAICRETTELGKDFVVTTIPKLIRSIRATWDKSATDDYGRLLTEDDVRRKYTLTDLLVIDEIGTQYGTDSELITINEIIDDRYVNSRPTVIIGNVKLSQIEKFLGSRAMDRIKNNAIILAFDWDSYRKPKQT